MCYFLNRFYVLSNRVTTVRAVCCGERAGGVTRPAVRHAASRSSRPPPTPPPRRPGQRVRRVARGVAVRRVAGVARRVRRAEPLESGNSVSSGRSCPPTRLPTCRPSPGRSCLSTCRCHRHRCSAGVTPAGRERCVVYLTCLNKTYNTPVTLVGERLTRRSNGILPNTEVGVFGAC